jgi:plastocyanin
MKRLMMYVIPLSAMAVLVFAAIAVAQSDQEGQEPSQDTTDANTTGVQNSTTVPPKTPAQTTTPTETTTPAKTTTPDPDSIITVEIHDHAFDLAELNIAPGTIVSFVNKDTEPHTATADNELFDTGVLRPGESSWVLFDGSGTVTYHCDLHPDMKGSIVVGEGGAVEGTTPQNQAAEEAPNEPSSDAAQPVTEAAQPVTEAAQPNRGY